MSERLERTDLVVLVCEGSDCKAGGSKAIRKAAKDLLRARGWKRRALVLKTKCTGHCKQGPICGIQPENAWLTEATPERLCARLEASIEREEGEG